MGEKDCGVESLFLVYNFFDFYFNFVFRFFVFHFICPSSLIRCDIFGELHAV